MRQLATRIREGGEKGDDVRVLQLKYDVIVANASTQQRSTNGLFKEACSTDLLFLIDTTGSMGAYIEAAKKQVRSIVEDIKEAFFNEADVQIAVVGYKDHGDSNKIQFLDFTSSTERVTDFLDELTAFGGGDAPEDVLSGIVQALNASWTQQTRCIIHIADAPAHGRTLNNFGETVDKYPVPGSEPHHLTHTPLLLKMIGLNINYALLRINNTTDKMAQQFLEAYAPYAPDCKLLATNIYYSQSREFLRNVRPMRGRRGRTLQFEEQELGTTYSALRHLVVRNVTTSASRTASRLSGSTARDSFDKEEDEEEPADVKLDTSAPQWDKSSFFDKTLTVEAFSTDVDPSVSLDDLIASDDAITISATDLTLRQHSRPFAQGALRIASYARTANSTSPLVVKSFKPRHGRTKNLAHLADDMRVQVLCKAFAHEFNRLASPPTPLDFVVATCLKPSSPSPSSTTDVPCMSLEPFLPGTYTKYNSNFGWVNESDAPIELVSKSAAAQAFSHYTFERSAGKLLVSDLQGVDGTLTDPAIHTMDPERFKLGDTNLGESGIKFFFATHKCNGYCKTLGLEASPAKMMGGSFIFRTDWGALKDEDDTVITCANKFCRHLVAKKDVMTEEGFDGEWCESCWSQLVSKKGETKALCSAGGGPMPHQFAVVNFYYEALGRPVPKECPEHRAPTL
ncbi:kinase-like domain-containing protein [Immersiella caudata]|uniref:Kinase-like domain-containing protein n=1 Tax=Immersiella caudata TaxID=314043 RepID=A0AA39XC80_9PEZI|nr:kinase-like domain-containing protein [Immersiella caudata]